MNTTKAAKIILPAFFIAVLAAGCAVDQIAYAPYIGQQQHWPVSPGAFVNQYGGVLIYHGWPNRPYTVVGKVVVNARIHERQVAWFAKAHGVDAAVILDSKTTTAGSVQFGGNSTTYFTGYTANTYTSPSYNVPIQRTLITALLIKFTSTTNSP